MRRFWGSFGAAVLSVVIAPAHASSEGAETIEIEQHAPVPCAIACPYWDGPRAAGFDACSNPTLPRGIWDETTFEITEDAPPVSIGAWSTYDYDSFVCTDTEPRRLLISMANSINDRCTFAGNYYPCPESASFTRSHLRAANGGVNDRFVLVSYNWWDPGALTVQIGGPVTVLDDSYEAMP